MRPMMKIIKKYIIALLLLIPVVASAQTDRDYIRQGNKAYKAKQYPESEVRYRKACQSIKKTRKPFITLDVLS